MKITRKNCGTCSTSTTVEIDDNGRIVSASLTGGCNGNIKGVCALVKGRDAKEVVTLLKGTKCGFKNTSCPDQLSLALEEALQKQAAK